MFGLSKAKKKIIHKRAVAIRPKHIVRHQIRLGARFLLYKFRVPLHLSFSQLISRNLSNSSMQRLNRQINWRVKV